MEPPKPIIAVVEDDQDTTEMLALALVMLGAEVVCIPHDGAIVEQLHAARPDLVILDMWLGGTDGATVLHGMRAVADLVHIPVVFFTAAEADVHARLPEERAVQVVAKPQVERLMGCVRASLPGLLQ